MDPLAGAPDGALEYATAAAHEPAPGRAARLVRHAIEDLCRAAAVSPADGSPNAGRAVRDLLGPGVRSDPQACALAAWLRRHTGLFNGYPEPDRGRPLLLVTTRGVLVMGPVPAAGGPRPQEKVPFPPAVAAFFQLPEVVLGRAA